MLDANVAAQLYEAFQRDLQHSIELNLKDWRRRPLHAKIWSQLAYQLHDQL